MSETKSPTRPVNIAAETDCQIKREKFWSELSIEEKIERTRLMVRRLLQDSSRTVTSARRLDAAFREHHHHPLAGVVVPVAHGDREHGLDDRPKSRQADGDDDCFF